MATQADLREKYRYTLHLLLKIKKANEGRDVAELQPAIEGVVALMDIADIEWVERVIGIKAI